MFRCILQSGDKYYCYNDGESTNLQDALCFETRYDADYEKDNNSVFKDGKVIPVILDDNGVVTPCPTQYLVVSYRQTKRVYSRSCLMETHDSKHEMAVFFNEEDVVNYIVKLDKNDEYHHWVLTQDEVFGGYNHFNSSGGYIPGNLKKLIEEKRSK